MIWFHFCDGKALTPGGYPVTFKRNGVGEAAVWEDKEKLLAWIARNFKRDDVRVWDTRVEVALPADGLRPARVLVWVAFSP